MKDEKVIQNESKARDTETNRRNESNVNFVHHDQSNRCNHVILDSFEELEMNGLPASCDEEPKRGHVCVEVWDCNEREYGLMFGGLIQAGVKRQEAISKLKMLATKALMLAEIFAMTLQI